MKKVAIMQPYLFPYIGYFQLINAVDEFVIYDDVQFIKGGWINRNNILLNKEKKLITFPLSGASANKKINEISFEENLSKTRKTIEMAYSRAPYKTEVNELINEILSFDNKNLAEFIANSINLICDYLEIKSKILKSSDLNKNSSLKGQDKVIDICEVLGAQTYINSIGGQELYDKKEFSGHGIDLKFLKPHLVEYKQFNNDFVPGLSIIDAMMFNSRDRVKEMLSDYELV